MIALVMFFNISDNAKIKLFSVRSSKTKLLSVHNSKTKLFSVHPFVGCELSLYSHPNFGEIDHRNQDFVCNRIHKFKCCKTTVRNNPRVLPVFVHYIHNAALRFTCSILYSVFSVTTPTVTPKPQNPNADGNFEEKIRLTIKEFSQRSGIKGSGKLVIVIKKNTRENNGITKQNTRRLSGTSKDR